jgi:transcriptional regulator with XRE-family HTH domain
MLEVEEIRRRFAKNLKQIIKDNKTNKLKVSKLIGCDSSLLSKWEKCEAQPTLEYIYKLTVVLNCTFEELVQD